jgi:hypothetical protein
MYTKICSESKELRSKSKWNPCVIICNIILLDKHFVGVSMKELLRVGIMSKYDVNQTKVITANTETDCC